MWFLHRGGTEVAGFGRYAPDDPLYVTHFDVVAQRATAVSVEFDDYALLDYAEDRLAEGAPPRLWVHTHPGSSPHPSGTDEATFPRVFGRCDWSVMFICSHTHDTYARMRLSAGPGADVLLGVEVDWSRAQDGLPSPAVVDAWEAEYLEKVRPVGYGADRFGPALPYQQYQGYAAYQGYGGRDDDDFPPYGYRRTHDDDPRRDGPRGGEGAYAAYDRAELEELKELEALDDLDGLDADEQAFVAHALRRYRDGEYDHEMNEVEDDDFGNRGNHWNDARG